MPYVSIPAISREKLSISAETRWQRIGEARPDLAPALALQRELLWLVAELAVSPFVHALQRLLFGTATGDLDAALDSWNRGYCPACGSWPAVAEVVSGHRILRCSFCATGWELN